MRITEAGRAYRPESGTIRPTFTSAGFCARAADPRNGRAAALDTSVRRVSEPNFCCILFSSLGRRLEAGDVASHTEIGLPDAVVGTQRRVRAFEDDATGL